MGPVKYILVFLCFSTLGYENSQDYETIAWSSEVKLTWKDFKGEAPSNDRAAATTASGISYQFTTNSINGEIELDYEVNTFFYPKMSWYQPHLCDSFVLSHEQLHFDISELYARQMRKRLATGTFTQNVKEEVKLIYNEILKELEEFQDIYDDQTNYSRDVQQQLIWNHKIEEALKN